MKKILVISLFLLAIGNVFAVDDNIGQRDDNPGCKKLKEIGDMKTAETVATVVKDIESNGSQVKPQ